MGGVALWAFQDQTSLVAHLPISYTQKVLFLQFYVAATSLLVMPASVVLRQRQLLMAEIEEHKALERLVADHSDDALLNLDERGNIRFASPAGSRLSGEEDLVGCSLAMFFDPLDELLVRGALANAAADPGRTHSFERAVVRGGDLVWLNVKLRAVMLDGAPEPLQGYAVTIGDVTARKLTELDALRDAETDALTGLPNRRALMARLEPRLRCADTRPFAVAILDLDHFKSVNDTHGHIVGDAVLREVAGVMRRMSSPRRFFARLGGEEFALICQQARFEDSAAVCETVRAAIAALRFTAADGTAFSVTASLGLAPVFRRTSASQALQAADTLLYQAKGAGRNRVVAGGEELTVRVNRKAA